VKFAFFQGKAADPAGPQVVVTVPPKGMVNLVDETANQVPVSRVTGRFEETTVITDRERVGPEVALWVRAWRFKAGSPCIGLHEFPGKPYICSLFHDFSHDNDGIKTLAPVSKIIRSGA
jgi:hypothetical protein